MIPKFAYQNDKALKKGIIPIFYKNPIPKGAYTSPVWSFENVY